MPHAPRGTRQDDHTLHSAERLRTLPQRPVCPKHCAERCQQLETHGGVDTLGHIACHGGVVLDWLLVCWVHVA